MSKAPPLQNPQPGVAIVTPNPNPNPSTSNSSAGPKWEASARSWFCALPAPGVPTASETDARINSNQQVILLHNPTPSSNQAPEANQVEHPYRFQRTDLWMPVYSWLESLESDEIVQAEEITGWLSANPEVKDRLFSRHPRYHLMHYIQKLHMKVLKKRGKLPKQGEITSPDLPLPEPERYTVHSFCKPLTASDTSTHEGFSAFRRHADECLPPLDMSQHPPWQELAAKELHGNEWHFRHIFRDLLLNGLPLGHASRNIAQSGRPKLYRHLNFIYIFTMAT